MARTLPLTPIVDVFINLSAVAVARKAFDLGLIIGKTSVIPLATRIKTYTGTDEMLEDGFRNDDDIFKAAVLYFGQNKKARRLAVGVQGEEETPLEAVQACRGANSEWYICGIAGGKTSKAEHEAIAAYIQTCCPSSLYAYTTSEEDVLNPVMGDDPLDIFSSMKALKYRRTIGQYSTTHPDAIWAIIGYAMGSQTGTANSAYTIALKPEVGVKTENAEKVFSSSAAENIKKNNGNIYLNRGEEYDVFERGTMADGTWFDEMVNLDKMANDIQLAIMDQLTKYPKVAQTEAGITQLHNAIKEPLEAARKIGFIASGVWKGQDLMELVYGVTLPSGYLIQSEPIDEQAQYDREQRKAPPIYVSVKLAGAIQSATIQVDVNR